MLVVQNLVKRYKSLKAVDNLSFSIEKGHIYGFVGANGAGKTTTMKIVAGLLKADSGTVVLDGVKLSENPGLVKSKIGYMPDFFGVYDDLKVSEYMDFYAGIHKAPEKGKQQTIMQLLELVNLEDRLDSYVDSLSRGMKQRLCLARSLIHDPKLLILDEPASGLDPGARAEMKEILKELKDMGKTVLISSHILPELSEICTSIGIIDHGKMVTSGTVDEIMQGISAEKIIRIKVVGEFDNALEFLKEQPAVGRVVVTNDYISAGFNGKDNEMAELLANMIKRGIQVLSFAEQQRDLESIFVNLTRGGMKNAG